MELMKMTRKNSVKLICPICGKEFYSLRPKKLTQCCSRKCSCKLRSNNYIKKYGKPYHNSDNNREKAKQTCLIKYNVSNPSQIEEIKQKKKNTSLKNFGKEFYAQTDDAKEHYKQYNLEKYGYEYIGQVPEIKEKIEQTNIKKYGHKSHNSNDLVKQHKKEAYLKKHGYECSFKDPKVKEKIKKVSLEKYGVENPGGSLKSQEKARATKLERYGNEFYNNYEKIRQTLLVNNTYNKSELENFIYKLLLKLNLTIIRQYSSKEYPWLCDFYIKELDLYIEIQGFPAHGKRGTKVLGPYDPNNNEHQKLLNTWLSKAKNNNWYATAIKIWTIEDPKKRQAVKENNLNWIEFFTLEEFIEWYLKLLETEK